MPPTLPPTLQPGDRVAVLSPSWRAPAHFPALHEQAILQITPAAASCDYGLSWDDPRSLTDRAPRESVPDQWSWSGPATVATGPTWGGNLEVLQWILAVGRDVLDVAAYQGCVLLLETSEEHPPPVEVFRAAVAEQVTQAVQEYAAGVPVVLGVDFGHTSPQWVLPYGGSMTVDGANRALVAHYGPPRPRVVSECG